MQSHQLAVDLRKSLDLNCLNVQCVLNVVVTAVRMRCQNSLATMSHILNLAAFSFSCL